MSLTLRGIKGSALTHAELDNNFLWLGNRGTSNLTLNGDVLTITRGDDSYYTISLSGVGTTVTGLSYTGNTLTLFQSDGSSESVVISADSFVTGFTYNNANKLTISQNQGKQDINVFINEMSGLTVNGTLNTNQIVLSGTNLTDILGNTVKKYSQTLTSPTAGRYTITHNLGTTDISVSLWLAFSNELTNAKILNRLPNSVDVEFSVAPGEDVLVLIMGTTVNSSGVAYIYSAVTVGPNQIVYGDATGLITSNSTFVRNPISGNIGVGVTSPSAKLHINNTGTDNTVLFEDNTNPDTTPFVIDNSGNVGIGTTTPTRVLDSRGTFNLQPSTNTLLRFDGLIMEAQVGNSNNQLVLNRDNFGITDLKGSGGVNISNPTYSNSLSIGGNTILRENDKIVFSRSDNNVQGWYDTINNRFRIGGGGITPIYSSVTSTLHVVGDFKVDGTNPDSLYVGTNGNVGIGTSTPTAKLTISANTPYYGDILNISNSQYPGIGTKIDGLGNLTVEGPPSTGYSQLTIKNSAGFQSGLVVDSNNIGSSIALKRSNQNRYNIVTNNVDTVDETLYVPFRTFLDSSHRILSRTGNTEIMYLDATVNNSKVGIGTTSPSSKLHIDGNNSSNGSYIRATQRTTGVGTISASQGTGPIYSAYTRIDGVGTSFSNDLTYGESITSSGFTLGIYQIISNTLLYTTLNTGATFSNQPYTLQGNSRLEVGNNYFNVGNGNLVSYDDGSSIFIGTSALGSNRYRRLSFGPEGQTWIYCDIADNKITLARPTLINGTSAGNTSYLSVGGDGTFSTKYIGLQGNGTNASTMFVIGQQDSNYNTTMRFSHRPQQYGYYYYAYGVSQNNASSIGIGTDPTSTHRLTVNDGLKLLSTPFNETILDIKQATSVSIDSSMASSPLINAYSANTIYGLRTVLNGTNIATNLNVGETITASGVTLTVSEKVDDNTLYTTYNSLAQFTGYSYTLQGLSRFNVLNNGNVGIGTTTPTSTLDINGTNGYNQLRLRTSFTPTGSTDTRGNVGDIAWDDNNFYWKTSTQWLRVSGQTF